MLQDIRSNFLKGPLAKGIAVIIALSFALFGVQSILVGGSDNTIATVNGEKISESTLRDSINNRIRRLVTILGEGFDPDELNEETIKAEALNSLISERILAQFISELDLAIAESDLGKEITSMEPFKENGNFSTQLYKAVLTNAGYTPASFKEQTKAEMLKRHLYTGIIGSDFVTPLELELESKVTTEKRDVRYVEIPMSYFNKDVVVSEKEVQEFYLKNAAFFSSEEKVSIEYFEIKSQQFIKPIEEQALIAEYESVKFDYEQPEENRISHILLSKKISESEQEFESRISVVEENLAEGKEFTNVASQFSDDSGSAKEGGDLGFSSGDAFPEEMELAASRLLVGEISGRIETDSGIHIILLTDRKEKIQASFEDLREELERKMELRDADTRILSVAEDLRDIVFNSSDLTKAAELAGSSIQISDLFSRSGLNEGLLAEKRVLAASFSDEVLKDGYNSEVIELSPRHFVVLRKSVHLPKKLKPLEEVEGDILQEIKDNKIRLLAVQEADRLGVAVINEEMTIEGIALRNDYNWNVEIGGTRANNNLPKEISKKIFSISSNQRLPITGSTFSDKGIVFLFELVRVQPGDIEKVSPQELSDMKKQLSQMWGEAAFSELQLDQTQVSEIEVF
tara:strand:+ start:1859 stop:3745 length:1887 start_codon:yes stop_codon:yes gene_type:complete